MAETDYRASRVCRVMGNPTAYQIIKLLLRNEKRPGQIAQELGLSLVNVSATLRTLRNLDLVRYETKWKDKTYRIKEEVVAEICDALEQLVGRLRKKEW